MKKLHIVIGIVSLSFALPQTHAQTGNTATGAQALANNTTGDWNTADGYQALLYNTSGNANTAVGVNALYSNTHFGSGPRYGGNVSSLRASGAD